jgi:PAS domain S-box-containing protein
VIAVDALAAVFEHSRDAIVVAEATGGRIVRWNPAAAAMFGYSPAEAARRHYWELFAEGREGRLPVGLAAYPNTRARIFGYAPLRVTGRGADGIAFPADVVVAPCSPDGSRAELVVLLVRDAAEALRTEQAEYDRVRLEGALVEARTVNHHLRNHLARGVGYASILAEDPTLSSDAASLMEHVMAGAEDAIGLLEQLMSITDLTESDEGGPGTILQIDGHAEPRPI